MSFRLTKILISSHIEDCSTNKQLLEKLIFCTEQLKSIMEDEKREQEERDQER